MKPISDTEAAYLAGLIDGDGCFVINVRQIKGRYSPSYQCALIIDVCQPELLEELRELTGIGVVRPSRPQIGNRRAAFAWIIYSQACEDLIRRIYPYLRLKRERADVALALRATKRKHPRRLTEDELAQREALKQRMHVLNKRGVEGRTDPFCDGVRREIARVRRELHFT